MEVPSLGVEASCEKRYHCAVVVRDHLQPCEQVSTRKSLEVLDEKRLNRGDCRIFDSERGVCVKRHWLGLLSLFPW